PVVARPGSFKSLGRLRRARTSAELWSEPVDVGESAAETFRDHTAVERLLAEAERSGRFATERTPAFLSWRYRFEPLHYRVVLLGSSLSAGVIVFRARRRGGALEATVCDVIAPPGGRRRNGFRQIARQGGIDYLLASAASAGLAEGFVPAISLGPVLTWKPINRAGIPAMASLALALADIELF
ncbi:MAG: GNAT family N-acetyltransferase, partial [Actinobacteria bacterium]|nr:GNAT family N-acetyltransferase [Actinomycetota bacterium]